jgi:alkylated DNA repair dioxygenase AlkB
MLVAQGPVPGLLLGPVPGLYLWDNFISKKEEAEAVAWFEADTGTPWRHSTFNGHCDTKCYGVRTQFGKGDEERIVRVNDVAKGEHDMPPFLEKYVARLREVVSAVSRSKTLPSVLHNFAPNECNVNFYSKEKGHYLSPHFDDRHLSGEVLMNLSLNGASVMTYSKGGSTSPHDSVRVDLPRRMLQLVTGDARYKFTHAIKKEDIVDVKRYSITLRMACPQHGTVRGAAVEKPGQTMDAFLMPAPDAPGQGGK